MSVCYKCREEKKDLFLCGRCCGVLYCSTVCLIADKDEHKKVCLPDTMGKTKEDFECRSEQFKHLKPKVIMRKVDDILRMETNILAIIAVDAALIVTKMFSHDELSKWMKPEMAAYLRRIPKTTLIVTMLFSDNKHLIEFMPDYHNGMATIKRVKDALGADMALKYFSSKS